jgi:hypothetical protein
MSATVIEPRPTTMPDPAVFRGRARWAAAALVVTGSALQVLEFLWENPPDDNATRVHQWVADPGSTAASMTAGLLAVPFLLGGFAVMLAVTRRHSPRLSAAAAAALVAAMVGLAGVHGVEMTAFAQATSGQVPAAVSVLDGEHVVAPFVALLLLFLGGAVVGTLLLAAAIWRSPLLPRAAALGVVAFAALDFAVSTPVVSHLVALANGVVVAWAVVTGYVRRAGGSAE